MNANELYPIVTHAIIVGICGQTGLVTSFIEHAISRAVASLIVGGGGVIFVYIRVLHN